MGHCESLAQLPLKPNTVLFSDSIYLIWSHFKFVFIISYYRVSRAYINEGSRSDNWKRSVLESVHS